TTTSSRRMPRRSCATAGCANSVATSVKNLSNARNDDVRTLCASDPWDERADVSRSVCSFLTSARALQLARDRRDPATDGGERKNLIRIGCGRAGHTRNHGACFVLRDGTRADGVECAHPLGAVAAHPGQHDAQAGGSERARACGEEHVRRGSYPSQGRLVQELNADAVLRASEAQVVRSRPQVDVAAADELQVACDADRQRALC